MSGEPTPITYDTKGTPPAIEAQDKLIEKFPVPIAKANVRVVPVDQMFEKDARTVPTLGRSTGCDAPRGLRVGFAGGGRARW